MIYFEDLVEAVQGQIAPFEELPTQKQVEKSIQDAAVVYSEDNPLILKYTFNLISGTDTYTLPIDFRSVAEFGGSATGIFNGSVAISSSGITPGPSVNSLIPNYIIRAGKIIFDPAPTVTEELVMLYSAFYFLEYEDVADPPPDPLPEPRLVYKNLNALEGRLLEHKALSFLFTMQAGHATRQGWRYNLSDEGVDKTKLPDHFKAMAKFHEDQYDELLDTIGAGEKGYTTKTTLEFEPYLSQIPPGGLYGAFNSRG